MTRLLVIPAAGRGSRLRASTPKPLVSVAGRTMLDRLADAYAPFVDRLVVVANPDSVEAIAAWAAGRAAIVVEQTAPTGMLDAILLAMPAVTAFRPGRVWITWADQVGVLRSTLDRLAMAEEPQPAPALIMPTVRRSDPYIHFTRGVDGRIAGLLQRKEGDPMPAEGESDAGLFSLSLDAFESALPEYARDAIAAPGSGERNFLPFAPWLARRQVVATIPATDPMEAVGINTPEDLRTIEAWLRTRGEG